MSMSRTRFALHYWHIHARGQVAHAAARETNARYHLAVTSSFRYASRGARTGHGSYDMRSQDFSPLLALPGLILALAILILFLWSVAWSYGDANARGKPGCLVAFLVALISWPLGLLLWVVFRPERRGY